MTLRQNVAYLHKYSDNTIQAVSTKIKLHQMNELLSKMWIVHL